GSWHRLGAFSTADLAKFIKRAAVLCGVEVTSLEDPERFELRLPEVLRGRFAEFGNRTLIEARTSREGFARSRTLLDFSSSFVRFLVESVTRPEFGGGFGVIPSVSGSRLIAAMLVHYQNEQGDPRGVDLVAGSRDATGQTEVDNSSLRPLFESYQRTGASATAEPADRKHAVDAVFE